MDILPFKQREEIEVPNILSHISIAVNTRQFSVKEERGLNEKVLSFNTKEELIEYLTQELKWVK